jgi:hypothetical protein
VQRMRKLLLFVAAPTNCRISSGTSVIGINKPAFSTIHYIFFLFLFLKKNFLLMVIACGKVDKKQGKYLVISL